MVDVEFEINSENSTRSSLRESIIEHLFIGEILKELWKERATQVEVLKPQVDDAGYDVVIECNRNSKPDTSIPCYIQLKSSFVGSKTAKVSLCEKLTNKPYWCVIWVSFDPKTLGLGPFRWFGVTSGQPSPDLANFKTTKHTKGDAKGNKAYRLGHRDVPKNKFDELASIQDLIGKLFPTE